MCDQNPLSQCDYDDVIQNDERKTRKTHPEPWLSHAFKFRSLQI